MTATMLVHLRRAGAHTTPPGALVPTRLVKDAPAQGRSASPRRDDSDPPPTTFSPDRPSTDRPSELAGHRAAAPNALIGSIAKESADQGGPCRTARGALTLRCGPRTRARDACHVVAASPMCRSTAGNSRQRGPTRTACRRTESAVGGGLWSLRGVADVDKSACALGSAEPNSATQRQHRTSVARRFPRVPNGISFASVAASRRAH